MTFHMRRRDKEITNVKTMKKILKSTEFVTIALCKGDQPYLVSLSHGYDETHNCIYFHCATEGKKLTYLKANNIVWGQALLDYGYAEGECDHIYASVHFSGRVTLVDKIDEKLRAIQCMMKQIDRNPEALIAKLDSEELKRIVIGRIDLNYMSGKKSKEVTI